MCPVFNNAQNDVATARIRDRMARSTSGAYRGDDGEHPSVILADIVERPRNGGHIIVVANEKGGVGKSTMAFHICVGLAEKGYRVAAIDLDRRQQSLARALDNRNGTARRLRIELPSPVFTALETQSGSMLCQEISRIGWDSDFVVIDAPGYDSAVARRAIAMADTLATPVNSSFVDLDLLGRFDPVSMKLKAPGCFSMLVNDLRAERARRDMKPLDWVVVQSRTRHNGSHNQQRIDKALQFLSTSIGFRLGHGLSERVAYRELFLLGLTHLDLRRIPDLARTQVHARGEILQLLADLDLPETPRDAEDRETAASPLFAQLLDEMPVGKRAVGEIVDG